MRSRGGNDSAHESNRRSDASSSRSEEESNRQGSQRSGKSELGGEPDSPSSNNNPIEYTEQERAELLRRLDSIKDHLLRGNVVDNNNKPTKEPFLRPVHVHGPPSPYYQQPYHEPYPAPNMYPQGYQDPYMFQNQRRPPPNPNYYPYPNRYPGGGQYVDIGADIVEPPHSYYPAIPSRYGELPPYSPVSSHNRGGPPFSPPVNNNNGSSYQSSMSSPGPRGGGGYARWPSDLDSEMGVFARGYVKKAVSDTDDARRCRPLGGGAPFIACHTCFELLYLPKKKLLTEEKRQHKLQCGACSEVISFTIVDQKLVFGSANVETVTVSEEVEDRNTTNVVVVEEQEPIEETTQSVNIASQCSDDEDRSSKSSEQEQKEVKSVRRRAKGAKDSEPSGPENASLLELFEYSNVNRAALAYGMEQIGYAKPHKQVVKQDSLKPESVATTETDVSYNGYSEESRYSNGTEDNNNRPRSRKGSELGSTENTTRSSTDRNEDQGKLLEVWVNGHLIPEELVSSAEKLAGPVQAGKYWYDYRAGFWGVIGKPCLGIIPPFIEEFSHPMQDNCAAGNTEVYVNGRELHKRDFELLVGRGLPQDKNRSYIVDISGRILDSDSGEELKSLGKLAPTIEKVKHGFGMRVPRSLAS